MNFSLLIVELMPLVIYIAVDAWKGFRAGIIAAMACIPLMIAYDYFVFTELDKFVLGEAFLIVVMGFVSLKMNNDRYFKFQPTVLALIFSGVFAWFQLFDKPLMLHFIPHMEKLMNAKSQEPHAGQISGNEEEQAAESPTLNMLHSKAYEKVLGRISGQLVWLFLAHGLIMAYAAMRWNTRTWFAWRMAIYPGLLVLVVINQVFL